MSAIEVTELRADLGQTDALPDAVLGVLPILQAQPGVEWVAFGPTWEAPDVCMLLVQWRDLSDHERFRSSPAFNQFVGAFRPLLAAPARVLHIASPASFGPTSRS